MESAQTIVDKAVTTRLKKAANAYSAASAHFASFASFVNAELAVLYDEFSSMAVEYDDGSTSLTIRFLEREIRLSFFVEFSATIDAVAGIRGHLISEVPDSRPMLLGEVHFSQTGVTTNWGVPPHGAPAALTDREDSLYIALHFVQLGLTAHPLTGTT